MSDLHYCQYAFARPDCRVQEIGAGVDPRFEVESIGDGPIAAVASRIGLDQFDPARLQGATAEDVRWLGQVAARHNEIICRAAESSAVLPLRLGTIFRSRDSLLAALARCRSPVVEFLKRLGDRREWGVKLYAAKLRVDEIDGPAGPPSPHYLSPARTGTDYLTRKKAQIEAKRELRAAMHRTVQSVEQCLTNKAEEYRRIRTLPSDLTGRSEEMVFNAAFLLPASAQAGWLETLHALRKDVHGKGLLLELSGPWPPYHFCPNLEL
jgi:hypothetical protein